MARQAERDAAASFLKNVAISWQPAHLDISIPAEAVIALTEMGPEGVSALRQLHAEGRVSDSQAKARLDQLAKASFDVTRP
jgi:hypothetical protein